MRKGTFVNRLSITRKIGVFILTHPKLLQAYVDARGKIPSIPRGYRKITKG
jgi:hypothetical protein